MAELFQRDKSVIGKHIRNVFNEGELEKDSVWAKFAYAATDGKTYQVDHYNLDVIFAELQAIRQRPMYMKDWIEKLDDFIKMTGSELLNHAEKISQENAKIKAELEYQKYKERDKDQLTQVDRDFLEHVKIAQRQLEQGKGKKR